MARKGHERVSVMLRSTMQATEIPPRRSIHLRGMAFVAAVGVLRWLAWGLVAGTFVIEGGCAPSRPPTVAIAKPHEPHVAFRIGLVPLEGDTGNAVTKVVVDELRHLHHHLDVRDVTLPHALGDPRASQAALAEARRALVDKDLDMLIWGEVHIINQVPKPRLFFASSGDPLDGKYDVSTVALPPTFWRDLGTVLNAVVSAEATKFDESRYVVADLKKHLDRVRTLIDEHAILQLAVPVGTTEGGAEKPVPLNQAWRWEDRASILRAYANGLVTLASQTDERIYLDEAGKRLEAAFASTAEKSRERGAVLADLCRVHRAIGDFELGTEHLLRAQKECEDALASQTAESTPLDWATTKQAHGSVLVMRGERELDEKLLADGVDEIEQALQVRLEHHATVAAAATECALGFALLRLSEYRADTKSLNRGIAVLRSALKVLSPTRQPLVWAKTENNLGAALMALGNRAWSVDVLTDAMTALNASLTVRRYDQMPVDWAMTLSNRGAVENLLGERSGKVAFFEQAEEDYRNVLKAYQSAGVTPESFRIRRNMALIQSALGARKNDVQLLEKAVVGAREVAAIDRKIAPAAWADGQQILGYTLNNLGWSRQSPELMLEGIKVTCGALAEEEAHGANPKGATLRGNLGALLHGLATSRPGPDAFNQVAEACGWSNHDKDNSEPALLILTKAVDALRDALRAQPRDTMPVEWATAMNNLGNALLSLGRRTPNSNASLVGAIDALEATLTERTRDREPLSWAKTESALGGAQAELGARAQDASLLARAAEAQQRAIDEFALQRVPDSLAETQEALGETLLRRCAIDCDRADLERAARAFDEVTRFRTRDQSLYSWALAKANLGFAHQKLAERGQGLDHLKLAVGAFTEALSAYTPKEAPLGYAGSAENLAIALALLYERDGGEEYGRESVERFKASLAAITIGAYRDRWLETQRRLGLALRRLGEGKKDVNILAEAEQAFRELAKIAGGKSKASAVAEAEIGEILLAVSDLTHAREPVAKAIAAFKAALPAYSRESEANDWGALHYELGVATKRLGSTRAQVCESLLHFERALEVANNGVRIAQVSQEIVNVAPNIDHGSRCANFTPAEWSLVSSARADASRYATGEAGK